MVVGALSHLILLLILRQSYGLFHQETYVATNVPSEFFNWRRLDFKTRKTPQSDGRMEAATYCTQLAFSQLCSAFRCLPDRCRYAAFPNETQLLVVPGELLENTELRKTIWVKKSSKRL